jgi:hypothetical protein
VAARAAFNLHFIFDDEKAPNRGSPATICYAPPECNAPNHFNAGPERATTQPYFQCARYLGRAMEAIATTSSNIARSLFFKKRRGITAELTGRRITT